MNKLFLPEGVALDIPCEPNDVSDGYHTFKELYDHRIALFIALCKQKQKLGGDLSNDVWRSKLPADGSSYEGWFIMGINYALGEQISYHLPMSEWDNIEFAMTLERAPKWDGHTPADVVERLKSL